MSSLLLLTFAPMLITSRLFAMADQPVDQLREDPDAVVAGINAETKTIRLQGKDGSARLQVGPKTWIIQDDQEGTFADFKLEQHVRARFLFRRSTGEAITLEVLPEQGAVAGRARYVVREYPEIVLKATNAKQRTIDFALPRGGYQVLQVSRKTWIRKTGGEATFADLKAGQRLHAWYIPRGGQAVILEVVPAKVDEAEAR